MLKTQQKMSNEVKKIIFFLSALFSFPVLALAHSADGCSQNVTGWWSNMMGGWGSMMGWGGMYGGAWGWLGFATYLVWLGISVLALIWLYKKVFGKK